MNMSNESGVIEKTGELVSDGYAKLGLAGPYQWFTCVDCGTTYPYFTEDQASELRKVFGAGIYCNGVTISKCPGHGGPDPIIRHRVVEEEDTRKLVRHIVSRPLPVPKKNRFLRFIERQCVRFLNTRWFR